MPLGLSNFHFLVFSDLLDDTSTHSVTSKLFYVRKSLNTLYAYNLVPGGMTDIKIQKVVALSLKGPYIQSKRESNTQLDTDTQRSK